MTECGTPVGEVPPAAVTPKTSGKKPAAPSKMTATFADNLPIVPGVRPEDEITYAVEVFNERSRQAGLSNQVHLPALPAIPPPLVFQAEVTSQGVKITWTCSSSLPEFAGVVYRMRVYRRPAGGQSDDKIAEPDFKDCTVLPVLDTSFEWEKSYEYRGAVVTVISVPGKPVVEIEGDDTPNLKVFAHDVFPPAVPSGLQAVSPVPDSNHSWT